MARRNGRHSRRKMRRAQAGHTVKNNHKPVVAKAGDSALAPGEIKGGALAWVKQNSGALLMSLGRAIGNGTRARVLATAGLCVTTSSAAVAATHSSVVEQVGEQLIERISDETRYMDGSAAARLVLEAVRN